MTTSADMLNCLALGAVTSVDKNVAHDGAVSTGQAQLAAFEIQRSVILPQLVNMQIETAANVVDSARVALAQNATISQNPSVSPGQVLIIPLRRREVVAAAGSTDTTDSGSHSQGSSTSSGTTSSGDTSSGNSSTTLLPDNQGGTPSAGQPDSPTQIPNVLGLGTDSASSPTDAQSGTGQSSDPASEPNAPLISLDRHVVVASGFGDAATNSTGAGNPDSNAGTDRSGSQVGARLLFTSAPHSPSGDGTTAASSWPDLVDVVLADSGPSSLQACLLDNFCLTRL